MKLIQVEAPSKVTRSLFNDEWVLDLGFQVERAEKVIGSTTELEIIRIFTSDNVDVLEFAKSLVGSEPIMVSACDSDLNWWLYYSFDGDRSSYREGMVENSWIAKRLWESSFVTEELPIK